MEETLGRLKGLSPVALREEVLAAGLKCGAVTASTRAMLEKKLARTLLERNGIASGITERASRCSTGEGENKEIETGMSSEEGAGEQVAALREKTEENLTETPSAYYAIRPQQDGCSKKDDKVHVFVNMKQTLRAMEEMKGSRFKAFSTREAAEGFSRGTDGCHPSPVRTPDGPPAWEPPESIGVSPASSEKVHGLHSPRASELTGKLRMVVEQGDQETFHSLVWENPLYLIKCIDNNNPTIIHEGCHYNVLHVAAKENQAAIAQELLDTLENPGFMRTLYPDDPENMLHQRIRFIVDMYLNTPDRTSNDTPLHYACKFGCPEVVEVLSSHPATDKQKRNAYGQRPADVICERKKRATPDMRSRIMEHLNDRCYVPLLRDADNSYQPVIGQPWSPSPLEMDYKPLGLDTSPVSPDLYVRAYVGPVSPSKAEEFYRLWRTPLQEKAKYFHQILKSDPDRGAERVGREIAHDMNYPWTEFWDFLDDFVDLSTEEGLTRLEEYLERKHRSPIHCTPRSVRPETETDEPADGERQSSSPEEETRSLGSPVCNLLPEFEKATSLDGSLKARERTEQSREVRQAISSETGLDLAGEGFWGRWWRKEKQKKVLEKRQEEEDLSSTCSEEYQTADEGTEASDGPRTDGLVRKDSTSSCSSYRSTRDLGEDHTLGQEPPSSQQFFIEGDSPSRLDREVLSALEKLDLDPERFPCVVKWRNTVLLYPPSKRLSWQSPAHRRTPTERRGLGASIWASPRHPGMENLNHLRSQTRTRGTRGGGLFNRTCFSPPE